MVRKRNLDSADEKNEAVEKPVPLPTLTHLQFLVLDIVAGNAEGISAQQAQDVLSRHGQNHRGPKFYQLMKRLEEAGLIESWYQTFDVAGGDVRRTYYKVTTAGEVAWRVTVQFYLTRMKASKHVFGVKSN